MKIVHLPLLKATTPLMDAVRAMRVQQRSAVVREEPTKLKLIKIGEIFVALDDQLTALSNVNISEPVYRPTAAEISQYKLNLKKPENTWSEWQSFLDDGSHSYALIDSYHGTALIATQHEFQGDEVELNPETCYCRGSHRHSIPPATIKAGNVCSLCGKKVRCV